MLQLIKKLRKLQQDVFLQSKELEWAHVYHDSIRGKEWLEQLPLNVGRWAGTYALFYILNRILNDYQPKSIVELGLGESSKFISSYLDNGLPDSSHLVIEQSAEWRDVFNARFQVSPRTEIKICEPAQRDVKGHRVNSYIGIEEIAKNKFDLYLIDGPTNSSPRFSRYDMVRIAAELQATDEFIIIVDDYERAGEKESVSDLLAMLKQKNINTYQGVFGGNATVLVIATEGYKYSTTV